MQQDIRTLKQISCVGMIALCLCLLVKLCPCTPENRLAEIPPPPNCVAIRAKSSITQPSIISFCSNCVQTSHTWQPKFCKNSRSRGQRSRSQRDIMCARIRKIISNSAGDWSILLKFCKITLIAWRLIYQRLSRSRGQRSSSQCDITYQHKNSIFQARISYRTWKVKIIPEPSVTCNAMFKVIRSKTEIAITPPRIARLRSNLVQSFITL